MPPRAPSRREKLLSLAGALLLAAASLGPVQAAAWDRYVHGTVGNIQLYADGSFTVTLAGGPSLCSGPAAGSWWAVNGLVSTRNGLTPDGVKAFYAALLSAKLSGRSVNLYTNNDAQNPTGQPCAIGALDLQD